MEAIMKKNKTNTNYMCNYTHDHPFTDFFYIDRNFICKIIKGKVIIF